MFYNSKYMIVNNKMIDKKYLKDLGQRETNTLFVEACFRNEFELVRYLLNSSELKYNANIHYNNDEGLSQAIVQGHIELVDYLLTSKELTRPASLSNDGYGPFKLACRTNQLKVIKYLFTTPQVKQNMKLFREIGVIEAVYKNQKEILSFLLMDLKNEEGTEKLYNDSFKDAYFYEILDLLKFLIVDLKLEKNETIQKYLEEQENASHNKYKKHKDFLQSVNEYFSLAHANKLEENLSNKIAKNTTKNKL